MKNKFTKHYTKQAFLMTSFSFHMLGMDKKNKQNILFKNIPIKLQE